jgi:lysophospholipase L1-like esterase
MAKILLIGDSMAEGLEGQLRALARAAGHSLIAKWKRGTTTRQWSKTATQIIAGARPDVVVVALGTNDAFNRRPAQETAASAAAIVRAIGNRPALWIGAPNSVKDRGTAAAIVGQVSNYFDSRTLTLPIRDNVHPTTQGFKAWANAVFNKIPLVAAAVPATKEPAAKPPTANKNDMGGLIVSLAISAILLALLGGSSRG